MLHSLLCHSFLNLSACIRKNYFESIAIIILPYAGLVIITPTRTPRMVMMANPRSVERSMRTRCSIAMNIVDADAMIIPSARFSRFRYRFGDRSILTVQTQPLCIPNLGRTP